MLRDLTNTLCKMKKCPRYNASLFTEIANAIFFVPNLNIHKRVVCNKCKSSIEIDLPYIDSADKSLPIGFSLGVLLGTFVLYYTRWTMPIKLTVMILGGVFIMILLWMILVLFIKIKK